MSHGLYVKAGSESVLRAERPVRSGHLGLDPLKAVIAACRVFAACRPIPAHVKSRKSDCAARMRCGCGRVDACNSAARLQQRYRRCGKVWSSGGVGLATCWQLSIATAGYSTLGLAEAAAPLTAGVCGGGVPHQRRPCPQEGLGWRLQRRQRQRTLEAAAVPPPAAQAGTPTAMTLSVSLAKMPPAPQPLPPPATLQPPCRHLLVLLMRRQRR
jgi:hypothetical protein